MASSEHSITLVAPPDDVDCVHELLARVWAESEWVSAIDRLSFETALIELASNVIRHAGRDVGVRCELSVTVSERRIEARLSDAGFGGEVDIVDQPMPDELSEQGRGIPLIRALVDEVEYTREGTLNRWRISRALSLGP